jgi:hypothetical protein
VKIVRLKKGYRIRLSDSEFKAIGSLVSLGEAYMEGMDDTERDDTERDMGRATFIKVTGPGSWAVDEDRRG